MLHTLRLTAIVLVGLAVPALAQAPASRPAPTPPAAVVAHPPAVAPPAAVARPPAAAPASVAPAAPQPTRAAPATQAAASGKIDINSASAQQLEALPGIGPALAGKIVAGRPWDDLDALVKQKVLPQGVLERNKPRLALASINTSSAADLAKTLPGIGEVRSRAIVAGRPYATPQELVSKKVLTQAAFDKIKDLIAE